MDETQKNSVSLPYGRWALQYALALPLLCALLAGVQYLKGQPLASAIEFGIVWSLATIALYALVRWRKVRKNIACVTTSQAGG